MTYLAATIVTLVSVLGVALTVLTLPGTWLILATALVCKFWQPDMFSWWTLGICAGLAVVGEIAEIVAGAVGASRAGGSKTGAAGAIVGTLIGAVLGIFIPVPVIGIVVGAAIGAGLGAMLAEQFIKKKDAGAAARIAAGAAAGRLIATVVKVSICAGIALTLSIAAFF